MVNMLNLCHHLFHPSHDETELVVAWSARERLEILLTYDTQRPHPASIEFDDFSPTILVPDFEVLLSN